MTRLACTAVALATACANPPPPRWLEGGAPLEMGDASWTRSDDSRVQVRANGEVRVDGKLVYGIDRVGRVVDEWNDPVAMLQPDGFLRGPGDVDLGRVGLNNAAPPGRNTGWLSLAPTGEVVQVDGEGERHADGKWTGCEGTMRRTCTLVTHVLRVMTQRDEVRAEKASQDLGIQ